MFHVAQPMTALPLAVQAITPRVTTPGTPWWLSIPDEYHVCDDCHKPFADEEMFHCDQCGCMLCPECAEVLQTSRQVQCSRCMEAH